jgi:hypothetical protein
MEPICRIAFATAPFASTPTWVDVSSDLMSLSIKRGRMNEMNRIEAGTATVKLLNISGDYWPNNTSSAYYGNLVPVKRISLQVGYPAASTYDVYTGFIESYNPDFILKPIKAPVMVIQCSDLFKNLNYYSINNTTGYPAELSGARVGRVLDAVTWPSTDRTLGTGQNTMASTGPISLENSLEHTYNVSMAEQGLFFIAPNGYATFQDRLHRSTATSEGTFGELPDLGITNYNFAMEDLYIYNDVRMTRDGGTEQVATDTTSQGVYGTRSYAQTGLINNTDDETQDIAYHLLDNWKTPAMRLKDITILPSAAPTTLYPQVLGRDISDKITVKLSQASINQDYFIEGIEHNWDAREPQMWATKWQLSNASIWRWPTSTTSTLNPDGAGDETNLAKIGAATNWEAVLDNTTGSYVYAANMALRDFYTLSNPPSVGYVVAVTVNTECWQSFGSGFVTPHIKSGGVIYSGPTEAVAAGVGSPSSHSYIFQQMHFNSTEINALQAGITLQAVGTSAVACSYLDVEVKSYTNWT